MSGRFPVGALLVGAAAVVMAIGWWVSNPPMRADARAVQEPLNFDGVASATAATESRRSTNATAVDAPLEVQDDGLRDADLWEHISDSTNSNLPAQLFADLTQLGMGVVRADATGKGRHRSPEYWGSAAGRPAKPCCTKIVIHSAGAYRVRADGDLVSVAVAWRAADRRDQSLRFANVLLAKTHDAWSPTRP